MPDNSSAPWGRRPSGAPRVMLVRVSSDAIPEAQEYMREVAEACRERFAPGLQDLTQAEIRQLSTQDIWVHRCMSTPEGFREYLKGEIKTMTNYLSGGSRRHEHLKVYYDCEGISDLPVFWVIGIGNKPSVTITQARAAMSAWRYNDA